MSGHPAGKRFASSSNSRLQWLLVIRKQVKEYLKYQSPSKSTSAELNRQSLVYGQALSANPINTPLSHRSSIDDRTMSVPNGLKTDAGMQGELAAYVKPSDVLLLVLAVAVLLYFLPRRLLGSWRAAQAAAEEATASSSPPPPKLD